MSGSGWIVVYFIFLNLNYHKIDNDQLPLYVEYPYAESVIGT